MARPDVLIESETILGIPPTLKLRQAAIVCSIDLFDAVWLVRGHEIDVAATGRKRCNSREQFACPGHTDGILPGLTPARVDVHDKMSSAVRISRRLRRHAAHGAADVGNEDLALWARQTRHCVGNCADRTIRQFDEIIRLPIVAGSGCEKRIECRLPAHEGSSDRSTDHPRRRHCRRCCGRHREPQWQDHARSQTAPLE